MTTNGRPLFLGYCANDAECIRDPSGLRCKCSPRFSGDKCQIDHCRGLCHNGGEPFGNEITVMISYQFSLVSGFCRETEVGVRCVCTSRFAGEFCDSHVNCSDYCLNDAKCDVVGDEYVCRYELW